MLNKLSLSLVLASCTLLPGCGACPSEKETKSTVATDVADVSGAMDRQADVQSAAVTAQAPEAQVEELTTKGGNALEGGKVHDYANLVNRSGDLKSILSNNSKVVVDFYAIWCGPCKALAPQLDKLAQSNSDVVFIKVDVDKFGSVSGSYGVRAMPTTVYFSNGKEIGRIQGADVSKVKAEIEKLKRS